ncbi:endonuclease SmrB [Flocculibacter collagenilyticus]|uniref:endonuclease SmrB n=1 Tax=Flocculibacter collagenilyticus TaxID=2744479 RepID=UPI0018F2D563|nr:endonuclease SmrB [Flocculibacter collagenilyticus]
MKKKNSVTNEDLVLFKQTLSGARQIEQDKIHPKPTSSKQKKQQVITKRERIHADFYFSDEFEPELPQHGPMQYIKPTAPSYLAKQLRRGDFYPDLILDLHGLRKDDAKVEITSLIYAAKKQHVKCVCIVHGLGGYILKQKVPHWLVQHPDVLAFHQAPLEWGGQGALLVLLDVNEDIR